MTRTFFSFRFWGSGEACRKSEIRAEGSRENYWDHSTAEAKIFLLYYAGFKGRSYQEKGVIGFGPTHRQ